MFRPQRGLRAELAAILGVDPYTQEYLAHHLPPPTEDVSNHLADIISRAMKIPDEARVLYAHIPALLLRIFGYETGRGWLETCSELSHRDRQALIGLVLPNGPLHSFCITHTDSRDTRFNPVSDMRFEFAKANLPPTTAQALSKDMTAARHSYLAPLLKSSLREPAGEKLFLSPLDYFFICMLTSPIRKWSYPPGSSRSSAKTPKRSRSIPSIRAQYNQVIAAYAMTLRAADNIDTESIFIPACLDFLFVPWAMSATGSRNHPHISTSAADAVAALLLSLPPDHPDTLGLDDLPQDSTPVAELHGSTNAGALYTWAAPMLQAVLMHVTSKTSSFAVCAYLRVLAIFLAPWRGPVHSIVKSMLFAKPRAPARANASPSMNAFQSTLFSMNVHLPSSPSMPANISLVKESVWRAAVRDRQKRFDKDLFLMACVNSTRTKIPAIDGGAKVLLVLGDAAHTARLSSVSIMESDDEQAEELQLCLQSLRQQKQLFERRTGRTDKDYPGLLAISVGQRIESEGVLGGISEIVNVGGAGGVLGMMQMVSTTRSRSHSASRRRLQGRRTAAASPARPADTELPSGTLRRDEVPFLGSVWDRPIAGGENEILVLGAYRVALILEPILGFVPNTRILGQYWVWATATVVLMTAMCFRYFVLWLVS